MKDALIRGTMSSKMGTNQWNPPPIMAAAPVYVQPQQPQVVYVQGGQPAMPQQQMPQARI